MRIKAININREPERADQRFSLIEIRVAKQFPKVKPTLRKQVWNRAAIHGKRGRENPDAPAPIPVPRASKERTKPRTRASFLSKCLEWSLSQEEGT